MYIYIIYIHYMCIHTYIYIYIIYLCVKNQYTYHMCIYIYICYVYPYAYIYIYMSPHGVCLGRWTMKLQPFGSAWPKLNVGGGWQTNCASFSQRRSLDSVGVSFETLGLSGLLKMECNIT